MWDMRTRWHLTSKKKRAAVTILLQKLNTAGKYKIILLLFLNFVHTSNNISLVISTTCMCVICTGTNFNIENKTKERRNETILYRCPYRHLLLVALNLQEYVINTTYLFVGHTLRSHMAIDCTIQSVCLSPSSKNINNIRAALRPKTKLTRAQNTPLGCHTVQYTQIIRLKKLVSINKRDCHAFRLVRWDLLYIIVKNNNKLLKHCPLASYIFEHF